MRTDPIIERAAELWACGATFPEIAAALHVDREAIRFALEGRDLYQWNPAPRSAHALEHEQARRREAELLIAQVEAFLASEGKAHA